MIGLSRTPQFAPEKIKPLSRLCSGEETTETRLVSLAAWMRERYGSTMVQALKTVIPVRGKVKPKEKRRLYLNIDKEEAEKLAESMEKADARPGPAWSARFLRSPRWIIPEPPGNWEQPPVC